MDSNHPARGQLRLPDVLAALGNPVRLGIVRELAASPGERTCGSLPLEITKATATHHWRVLREAGITCEQREGRHKAVTLRRGDLETRFPGLLPAILNALTPADASLRPAGPTR